jgi:hypothetical protein
VRNRWGVLAVLFVARLSMSFQFQSVAAVAPLLSHDFGVGPGSWPPDNTLCNAGNEP